MTKGATTTDNATANLKAVSELLYFESNRGYKSALHDMIEAWITSPMTNNTDHERRAEIWFCYSNLCKFFDTVK